MKISKRDWVQLSTYVDGELTQRELTRLEARIENNPEFQAALEELRNVKKVLAHTPRLSVPRNFTLQQSLVESAPKPVPTRRYRLAAAVLSFLFIGVVVVDLGSTALSGGMLASQAPRAEEVMLESAADEMEEPSAMLAAEEETGEEDAAPEAEMETAAKVPEASDSVAEGESEGFEEWQPPAPVEESDRAAESGDGVDGEEPQEALNMVSDEEDLPAPAPEEEQAILPRQIPWLRIIEIILGLGAVGFGLTAWLKRRKSRKS